MQRIIRARHWREYQTVALIFLLCCALFTTNVQAQSAYLEGNRVYLPVVEDFPFDKSYELRLLPKTRPEQFALEYVGAALGQVTASSAWYEDDLLIVPEVWINNVSYWAELREISSQRFVLVDFGRNKQQVLPAPGEYEHQYWERIPGLAKDIGVGADGTVWVVGASEYGYDYGLYSWDGRRWYQRNGSAVRVDVDPQGRPWIINDYNEIWMLDRGRWERIRGAATDIGIGADGSVWSLGVTERRGGYEIFRLGSRGWMKVEGSAIRIDVDPLGVPWVINHDDQIFRLENGSWRRIPGLAKDIGIGADGTVWVIGSDERAGGYGIYQYNGSGWDKVDGSGRQISVGPFGAPWVVNSAGDIYRSWGY